jgi:polyhydroxyalkanoate synthesis regulator phasin
MAPECVGELMPARFETQGSIPVPDPTRLTTDAVRAAQEEIEKLFDTKLTGFRELVTEKFAGRDTALAAALKAAQELVKQQNDSNTIAIDKAATAFTKQIDSLDEKINDLKARVADLSGRNWASVGGYIVGAAGVIAVVISVLNKMP